MEEKMKVTFLVNTAVLLEYQGTKLLIDGIYDQNGHCFSNLSPAQWEKLKHGEGEFSCIDYLLFTHEHGDHFSPQRVIEYLTFQTPKAIFMPMYGSKSLQQLSRSIAEKKIPCALLQESICRKTIFKPEKDICIQAFQTRHLDKKYWNVPHFCYLMGFGKKNLLFTSDVDFSYESFSQCEGVSIDAVFVNPLMSCSKEGRKLLDHGVLQAKKEVVYHIPFAQDDSMQIRKMAEQKWRTEKEKKRNVIYFLEEGQTCFF